MAVHMTPMFTRKKEVYGRFKPDTFRIFGEVADLRQNRVTMSAETAKTSSLNCYHKMPDIAKTSLSLPSETARLGMRNSDIDYRKNKPHPNNCHFLRDDARLLNEPICTVQSRKQLTMEEPFAKREHPWWPNYVPSGPIPSPKHTLDTIARSDFQYIRDKVPPRSTRHGSNPNRTGALGIAPVNHLIDRDGRQRFFKERMSYEHMYDCRKNTNYPIRAKRHGAYVYQPINPQTGAKYLSDPGFKTIQRVWTPEDNHPRASSQTSSTRILLNEGTAPRDIKTETSSISADKFIRTDNQENTTSYDSIQALESLYQDS